MEYRVSRQARATLQTDPVGLRVVDTPGADRMMWASDYPHPDSTWPESRPAIEENFRGVASAVRRLVLCDNAKHLFGR